MFNNDKKKVQVTAEGEMPAVRKMNRGQVLEFNKRGYNPIRNKTMLEFQQRMEQAQKDKDKGEDVEIDIGGLVNALQLSEEADNWILENVYPEYDFNEADWLASQKLAAETYTQTFNIGKAEEVKNS